MYVEDYDGYLSPTSIEIVGTYNGKEVGETWAAKIKPYVQDSYDDYIYFGNRYWKGTGAVFACPTVVGKYKLGPPPYCPAHNKRTYGYSWHALDKKSFKYGRSKHPAQCLLLTSSSYDYGYVLNGYLIAPHSEKANMLFLDGHVEAKSIDWYNTHAVSTWPYQL